MTNGFSDKIVEYLLTLPEGTEISTSEAANAVFGCTFTDSGDYKFGETVVTFNTIVVKNGSEVLESGIVPATITIAE